ncbi:MAG: peptide deformylase [Tatlockia sp.]|nr:peptide deformylase [Tatlockia sp.]
MNEKNAPTLLDFASSRAAILHRVIKPLMYPLSKDDRKLIRDMKYSILPPQLSKQNAAWSDSVGMAANQWGLEKRIFLFAPEGTSKGIEVVINPAYVPVLDSETDYEWEGCFSLPLTLGYVQRYTKIRINYQNEEGKFITKILKGYPARVWQHETDHLDGLLYDNAKARICLEKMVFLTQQAAELFYDAKDKEQGR